MGDVKGPQTQVNTDINFDVRYYDSFFELTYQVCSIVAYAKVHVLSVISSQVDTAKHVMK